MSKTEQKLTSLLRDLRWGFVPSSIDLSGQDLVDTQLNELLSALKRLCTKQLKKLQILNLSGNKLKNVYIFNLPGVQKLILNNNKIDKLLISNMPALKTLDVLHNPLSIFDPRRFAHLKISAPKAALVQYDLQRPTNFTVANLSKYFSDAIILYLSKPEVNDALCDKYYTFGVCGLPHDVIVEILWDEGYPNFIHNVLNLIQGLQDNNPLSNNHDKKLLLDKFVDESLPEVIMQKKHLLYRVLNKNQALQNQIAKKQALLFKAKADSSKKPVKQNMLYRFAQTLKNSLQSTSALSACRSKPSIV